MYVQVSKKSSLAFRPQNSSLLHKVSMYDCAAITATHSGYPQ